MTASNCDQVIAGISVIPKPVSAVFQPGIFTLAASCRIVATKELQGVASLLRCALSSATGFPFEIRSAGGRGDVHLKIDPFLRQPSTEGYSLEVKPDGVAVSAATAAGLFYGCMTFLQFFSPDIFRKATAEPGRSWVLPCARIVDEPRFQWRGAMVDVARHFYPKDFLLKLIDQLALHKLNRLHLHLTDDQGWRIEIKRYPRLTQVGAWRADSAKTMDPPTFSGEPHGGFYTQDELREIVAYARERFVQIVPEIEMPGHSSAAIASYPELGNLDRPIPVPIRWGIIENILNVQDSTLDFFRSVLDEVMDIFPGEFIHIGGDECPKEQWKLSCHAQKRMKDEGLGNEDELQSWFIRQISSHIQNRGRRLIGWSEILEGGLAQGAALMVWLGDEGALEATKSGHDVVMAQTSHTYFDFPQSPNRAENPYGIREVLPLDRVYAYEPILPAMTEEQSGRVLGVQFQLWSEYVPTPFHAEHMIFPRACALAEVAWSNRESRDFDDFKLRLNLHLLRLDVCGVHYRPLDGPAGWQRAGCWRTGELAEKFTTCEWVIQLPPCKEGSVEILFQYLRGDCLLEIEWVKIASNGKILGCDGHVGSTGWRNFDNTYHIKISATPSNAITTILASVRTDGGTDSEGAVYWRWHRP